MPNYVVHTNGRTVFPALSHEGHTLEADNGDIVSLDESCPEDVIQGFIDSGHLVATSKPIPKKTPAPPADTEAVQRSARQIKAEIKAAEKAAKDEADAAAAEAARLEAESAQAAADAATDPDTDL